MFKILDDLLKKRSGLHARARVRVRVRVRVNRQADWNLTDNILGYFTTV
jgi:hypothetical protein